MMPMNILRRWLFLCLACAYGLNYGYILPGIVCSFSFMVILLVISANQTIIRLFNETSIQEPPYWNTVVVEVNVVLFIHKPFMYLWYTTINIKTYRYGGHSTCDIKKCDRIQTCKELYGSCVKSIRYWNEEYSRDSCSLPYIILAVIKPKNVDCIKFWLSAIKCANQKLSEFIKFWVSPIIFRMTLVLEKQLKQHDRANKEWRVLKRLFALVR